MAGMVRKSLEQLFRKAPQVIWGSRPISHLAVEHETLEERIQRYECIFERTDMDGWDVRQAMNDLVAYDSVPDPKIIIAGLLACRRLNDYALSVRFLEMVKDKCGCKVNQIYPYIVQEVQETVECLGANFPEDLCFHEPEKYLPSVFEMISRKVPSSRLRTLEARALSTIQTKTKLSASVPSMVSKDESREFMALFPDIVRDLTEAGRHTDIPLVTKRFAKVLQYNVPNGKKNRGLALVMAYKLLEQPQNLTPENIRFANILGWCVEMLQGFFLVADDMMDNSESRRGAPCWYRKPEIGLSAINDSILLEAGLYTILKKYFKDHPIYLPAMELFHEVTMKTTMGQALDITTSSTGKPNLSLFTMDNYMSIVKYKTSYYTFQLPVALAMYLANFFDPEQHRQAKTILLEMGQFFQIQDDFLDCFGDPEVSGKVGTDIQEGKCSWLAVVALQRANAAQRQIMQEHYGVNDVKSVEIVKKLYEELSLPNTYAIYEEESYNIIRTHIQQISKGLPHDLFFKMMEKIYRREA